MAAPNLLSDPGLGEEAAEQAARPVLRLIQGGLEAAPEATEAIEGVTILAPEVVIPIVIGVVVVGGLIALGYYLYEKSQEQPEPPKPVQPCPQPIPAPPPTPAPALQPAPAPPPSASGYAKKEPVKPANLSKQESEHWDQCKQKHDDYKKLQSEFGRRSAAFKDIKRRLGTGQPVSPAEMQAFCDSLADQIETVKKEIAVRKDYIDSGCDKFDWFNKGETEQERKAAHEGQVEQTEQQVDNLVKARDKYCPGQVPPPNQNNNQDFPNS
jgi:hypothetical protein